MPWTSQLLQSSGAAQSAFPHTLSLSAQPSLYALSIALAFAKPQAHLRLSLLQRTLCSPPFSPAETWPLSSSSSSSSLPQRTWGGSHYVSLPHSRMYPSNLEMLFFLPGLVAYSIPPPNVYNLPFPEPFLIFSRSGVKIVSSREHLAFHPIYHHSGHRLLTCLTKLCPAPLRQLRLVKCPGI